MADGVSDDGNGGEPLILAAPTGRKDVITFEDAMDEEVEVIEHEQKILAKIICTPGVKTFVADIVKQMFAIIKDIDTSATITSASGLKIKTINDFPKGKKFSDAFKPIQSIDTKSVRMIFKVFTLTSFQSIKSRHTRLMDFLRTKNMYLNESHSGSDNEQLIGYLLGFQADKVHLTGLTEDIREMMDNIVFQEGENQLGRSGNKFPPFYLRVRNITRVHQNAEYASKAIGIIVAEEHSTLARTLLTRATEEKLMPGLGRFYNSVPNDRQFYRVIKWNNDTTDKTTIIPVLGITRKAMLASLKINRIAGDDSIITNLRSEIANSDYFSAIHSTKATDTEGRWILVVADATKVKEASQYFLQITKSIYQATQSQIPADARLSDYEIPEIEGKAIAMARATRPISAQQASAWGPIFSDNDTTTTTGSRMRNLPSRKPRQVRKIVELSFDPESKEDFSHLQTKSPTKSSRSVTSKQSIESSHSSVSGVTKADLTNLGAELRAMLNDRLKEKSSENKSESKSINTNQTDLTMVTLLRDDMARNHEENARNRKADEERLMAYRKADKEVASELADRADARLERMQQQMHEQMQLQSQQQMTMLQQMISPMIAQEVSKINKTQTSESASINSESHSATVTHTKHRSSNTDTMSTPERPPPDVNRTELTRTPLESIFTQPDVAGQPPEQTDNLMHEQQSHIKPNSSGMTPPPKKSRSAQKRVLDNRKLNAEFDAVRSFQESADSQGADGGGL